MRALHVPNKSMPAGSTGHSWGATDRVHAQRSTSQPGGSVTTALARQACSCPSDVRSKQAYAGIPSSMPDPCPEQASPRREPPVNRVNSVWSASSPTLRLGQSRLTVHFPSWCCPRCPTVPEPGLTCGNLWDSSRRSVSHLSHPFPSCFSRVRPERAETRREGWARPGPLRVPGEPREGAGPPHPSRAQYGHKQPEMPGVGLGGGCGIRTHDDGHPPYRFSRPRHPSTPNVALTCANARSRGYCNSHVCTYSARSPENTPVNVTQRRGVSAP